MYDVEVIREDFPILQRRVGERPLVYLDSANTSQKPRQVVDAIAEHYLTHNANVARAMHLLGAEATAAFEGGRSKVAGFVGADRRTVVFAANLAWRHRALADELERLVSLPVVVENDANAAGWAEFRFGAATEAEHMLMVTVGTGLGGAIVLNGELVYFIL